MREAAGDRFDDLIFDVYPSGWPAVLTDDPRAEAPSSSRTWRGRTPVDLTVDEVLESPHVFIGTIDSFVEKFERLREELGITSFMMGDVDDLARSWSASAGPDRGRAVHPVGASPGRLDAWHPRPPAVPVEDDGLWTPERRGPPDRRAGPDDHARRLRGARGLDGHADRRPRARRHRALRLGLHGVHARVAHRHRGRAAASSTGAGWARPFAVGIGLFALGLLVGGLAPSMAVLVAARFVQGLGAGMVPPIAYVAIGRSLPERLRPQMFATLSTAWVLPGVSARPSPGSVGEHARLALRLPGPAAAHRDRRRPIAYPQSGVGPAPPSSPPEAATRPPCAAGYRWPSSWRAARACSWLG